MNNIMGIKYADYDFVEDVKTLIIEDEDVSCSSEVQKKIDNFNSGILLKVDKGIGSKVKILSVTEVTEDNVLDI